MPSDDDFEEALRARGLHRTLEAGSDEAPSLKSAVKDAYTQASAANRGAAGEPKVYRVVDIWAVGTNPLSEYIVAWVPIPTSVTASYSGRRRHEPSRMEVGR